MLNNINLFEIYLINSNKINYKKKYNIYSIVKNKYQPLRYLIYIYYLYFITLSYFTIVSFKYNNIIKTYYNIY
uniref:Ymf69 n=1 Tax=Tetrahymena paravorax TaxID=5905 RepID=Q09F61_TETPR|nr:Ymf69 [Tetrahymena paravorax]ABI51690.1 Ymf69 [Tetrahymena paravorax]